MLVLALALSYLLGSIPTAYLLVKWTTGVDVRTVGSGNVGATNAGRAAGRGIGAAVFLLDLAKGAIASAGISRWCLGSPAPSLMLLCGLAAVTGHLWSCFLRFQGGKGVATTIGALLGYAPSLAAIVMAVWVAVFVCCRYVSVSSRVAAAALPIGQALTHRTFSEVALGSVLALLIEVRHQGNLRRLLSGVEPRVGGRSRKNVH